MRKFNKILLFGAMFLSVIFNTGTIMAKTNNLSNQMETMSSKQPVATFSHTIIDDDIVEVTLIASEEIEPLLGWVKIKGNIYIKQFNKTDSVNVTIKNLNGNSNTITIDIQQLLLPKTGFDDFKDFYMLFIILGFVSITIFGSYANKRMNLFKA